MKVAVIVYSRTGTTRGVGRYLAQACGTVMYEIRDSCRRGGLFGFLRAGIDAMTGRRPAIQPPSFDPSAYDLIILGAPVWANHVAAPMRTFIERNKMRLRRLALFCTTGRGHSDAALDEMASIAAQVPIATLVLAQDEISGPAGARKIRRFIWTLRSMPATPAGSAIAPDAVDRPALYLVGKLNPR